MRRLQGAAIPLSGLTGLMASFTQNFEGFAGTSPKTPARSCGRSDIPIALHDSRNLARNRQEYPRAQVYAPGAALDDSEWAPLIATIVRVTRFTLIRSAATGLWKRPEETAFYASFVMLPAKNLRERHPRSLGRGKREPLGSLRVPRRGRQSHPRQSRRHGVLAFANSQHRQSKRRPKHRPNPLERHSIPAPHLSYRGM